MRSAHGGRPFERVVDAPLSGRLWYANSGAEVAWSTCARPGLPEPRHLARNSPCSPHHGPGSKCAAILTWLGCAATPVCAARHGAVMCQGGALRAFVRRVSGAGAAQPAVLGLDRSHGHGRVPYGSRKGLSPIANTIFSNRAATPEMERDATSISGIGKSPKNYKACYVFPVRLKDRAYGCTSVRHVLVDVLVRARALLKLSCL